MLLQLADAAAAAVAVAVAVAAAAAMALLCNAANCWALCQACSLMLLMWLALVLHALAVEEGLQELGAALRGFDP